jgi:DNA primase
LGSPKIPYSFVQELLSRVDIVDIVSNYIQLKQVGRNYTTVCPFHPEKTPSFVVSPEKQIFKCFGCGIGGNAITFVEKYENLSFPEAIRRVAELAGVEVPSEFKEEEKFSLIEEAGYKVAKYFNSKVSHVRDYLESRKITESSIERFLIGYAPSGYSKELNINSSVAKELGLINSKGKGFFTGRLMIPIFSHSGKVVAFAGRTLRNDKSVPKYINSPESELFKKNSILYGFYQSREAILKEKRVVIVEGYFDVISLHQAGIRNTVAPMGTSLTESHVKIVKRYSSSPILMFDGDSAGRKATIRSAGLFLSEGIEPLVVQLPAGEDPDSMAGKNLELLNELLSNPLRFIEWSIRTVKELSDEEKSVILKEVIHAISPLKVVDPFRYKSFVSKLAAEFEIDENWIRLNAVRYRKDKQEEKISPVPHYEKAFLRAFIEDLFSLPIEVSPNIFVSEEVSRVYSILRAMDRRDPGIIQLQFPELSDFLAEVLLSGFSEEELKMAVCRTLSKEIERRMKKTQELHEKKKLKKLVFDLRKGNLERLSSVVFKITG